MVLSIKYVDELGGRSGELEIELEDRDGQPLNGLYEARAFLTTSGPFPRVEAATEFFVMVAYPP